MFAWIGSWFTGLGRWLQPDTWIAFGYAAAVIAVMSGILLFRHDIRSDKETAVTQAKTLATAQCDQKWVAEQIAQSTAAANRAAAQSEATANAAENARADAEGERDAALARAADLAATLAATKDNPVVWPRDIARSLRK